MIQKLSEFELDALREIVAIGAGHASTALSQMTNKKIIVSFPSIKAYPIEKIPSLVGKPEKLVTTVYLRIEGKRKSKKFPVGGLLLIFSEKSAIRLANLLQGKKSEELDELDKDALKETGNILCGTCLRALTHFLDFEMIESLPGIACDMLNATLDSILANIADKTEAVLVFKTNFTIEGHEIKSYFLILFNPEMYSLLIEKIEKAQNA
jgi:chemotaxis protein CheC